MSIPPLVCSTPPPPDQCDDDKENDDFELNYSSSQEDDYERSQYDFCNFNNSNSKERSPCDITLQAPPDLTKVVEVKNDETSKECDNVQITAPINNPIKIKLDEDNNIEDLDLQFDQVSISVTKEPENIIKHEKDSEKDENITELSPTVSGNETAENSPSMSSGLGTSFSESINNQEIDDKAKIEISDDFIIETFNENEMPPAFCETDVDNLEIISNHFAQSVNIESLQSDIKNEIVEEPKINVTNLSEPEFTLNPTTEKEIKKESIAQDVLERVNVTDDFQEFDDFQFSQPPSTNLPTNEFDVNPWGNEHSSEGFGEFHANFDDIKVNQTVSDNNEEVPEVVEKNNYNNDNDDDDDFGDFDDFRSSNVEMEKEENIASCGDVPVFNLQTSQNESQYLEKVANILKSVFEEEIVEPFKKFDSILENSLCETWGHLLDAEVRQPYMIKWNNSLGQKTLLRSLCIDSRNILFGPKWGNTPRYAANLGVAPLQPLKRTSQVGTASQSDNTHNEKQHGSDTWTDPFTEDRQESCNPNDGAETVNPRLAMPSGVSETTSSSDKVYPSSLNIPPLCQINLPDTHIFTPTDSETPRSKTIHYDNGSPVLIPHSSKDIVVNNDDNEYSDFQDFKAKPNTSTPSASSNVPYKSYSVLQPIKMEPLMPTLNWPDPGEVKETFNDFTDFVSNSTWFEDNKDVANTQTTVKSEYNPEKINETIPSILQQEQPDPTSDKGNNFDDFDNFQSAFTSQQTNLPPSISKVNEKSVSENPFNSISTELPASVSKFDFQLTDNILPKPNHNPPPNVDNTFAINKNWGNEAPTVFDNVNKSTVSVMGSQLLQPTPAVATQTKPNTNQILQPLSLESISQINWPNPGIDLQDLSRFNPVEKVHSIQADNNVSGTSKGASPIHSNTVQQDDEGWGDFVSSKPKQNNTSPNTQVFVEDDEWSDFMSSPGVRTQNGLNTISFNVHANTNIQNKTNQSKIKQEGKRIDMPSLNYVTPKGANYRARPNQHFQNL